MRGNRRSYAPALLALLLAGAVFADPARTHVMHGTVVAVDPMYHMLTIELADGSRMTGPVVDGARDALAGLKDGAWVAVTCRDVPDGSHEAIVAIEVEAKPG